MPCKGNQMIILYIPEIQKKQIEDSVELIQEECISENADNSTEEPIEGGLDGDGEEMTDGIDEDFDEEGSNELVRYYKCPMYSKEKGRQNTKRWLSCSIFQFNL